jgi:hypothetical protein
MVLVLEDLAGSTCFLKVLDSSKKRDRRMLTVFQSE